MSLRRAVLAAGALLHFSLLSAQEPLTFAVRQDVDPCLNVRARPEAAAPALGCLPPGTTITAVGTAPYWRQVRLADGRIGWAAKRYLESRAVAAPAAGAADRDDAWLEIHIIDVGQGDGIWIHTFDDNVPNNGRYEGRNILIDGGPNSAESENEFLRYLLPRAHEGARIDALIITHPHADHYPGAIGVLRHFEVREFYDSGYPSTKDSWRAFLNLVSAETADGTPIVTHAGLAELGTPDWGSELQVRFLHAWSGSAAGLGSGSTLENNASVVFRIQYGSQSFLFMGDAEGKNRDEDGSTPKYVERRLLDAVGPAGLRSTVLKIAHHGSETSSTTPFIRAVDPAYVVVSSGRRPYGGRFLPDASTLRRYCAHRAATRIYRTDQGDEAEGRTGATDADGDHVLIRTNGRTTAVTGLSGGNPITHTACVS
jgi:competence protein ComEC